MKTDNSDIIPMLSNGVFPTVTCARMISKLYTHCIFARQWCYNYYLMYANNAPQWDLLFRLACLHLRVYMYEY